MSKVKELAKAGALAAAPELAVPAELLAAARRRSRAPPSSVVGETIVVPPADKTPILTFGKDRVRVRTVKGIRIVTVERAKGISGTELAALALVAGAAVATYELYKAVKSTEQAFSQATTINLGPLGSFKL